MVLPNPDSLQSAPDVTSEWTEHEHHSPALAVFASKLLFEAGNSLELARQALDAVSRTPVESRPSAETLPTLAQASVEEQSAVIVGQNGVRWLITRLPPEEVSGRYTGPTSAEQKTHTMPFSDDPAGKSD